MFTILHTKSQNWLNRLYMILLLVIPLPIHKITRKFVFQVVPDPKRRLFQTQNAGVPDPKHRCSRPKPEAFQLCSRAVPEVFQKLFQYRKLHQNYNWVEELVT